MRNRLGDKTVKAVWWTLSTFALFALGFTLYELVSAQRTLERQMISTAKSESQKKAILLKEQLLHAEELGVQVAEWAHEKGSSPERLESYILSILDENPNVYGIGVSYLRDAHPKVPGLYAPFAVQTPEKKLLRVEEAYDYTDGTHQWFDDAIAKGALWVPVYWGQASQSNLATYSVPVKDKDGKICAVVCIDIALGNLWELVGSLNFSSTGYSFLVSSDGVLMVHPDRQLVMKKKSILSEELTPRDGNTDIELVRQALISDSQTLIKRNNIITNQPSLTVFTPVPGTDWYFGSTFVCKEFEISHREILNLWMHVVSASIVLACCLALLFMVSALPSKSQDFCRYASMFSGMMISVGILSLWVLQNQLGVDSPYHDRIIDTQSTISSFQQAVKAEKEEAHQLPPEFIPCGVLVRSIKMTERNEVRVTGILWHIYNKDLPQVSREFWFPDSSDTKLKEIYRTENGADEVVGMSFDASLRQTFDNHIYPFDDVAIRLRIRPRQVLGSQVYVPDLAAYDVVIPGAVPFVANNISIPGWEVVQTYFTTQVHGYGMDYGLHGRAIDSSVRDLVLTVKLKRKWLENFLSVIIPVLVIILLSYGSIRMTTGKPEQFEIYDFKPMRMIVVGSTFSLFIIFATINLRNRVTSESITYIEQIYFLLYLMTFSNVFISMKISKRSEHFLFRNDGRLIKAFYLPVVLGIIFLITLFAFYN